MTTQPERTRRPLARCAAGFGFLAVVVGLAACGQSAAPPAKLTPVSVQLNWVAQGHLGGVFAADQTGLYRAENLAVTFVPIGTGDPIPPVVAGTSQFGIAGADELILARAKGQPIRAIAVVFRRSPIVFVTLADSGITRPQEFAGKTIRTGPGLAPTLRSVMARVGVPRDGYREIILPSEVSAFTSGQAPVWALYVTGLTLTLQRAGFRLNLIYPDDYGVHFYADTLYTTDALIAANPELVRRFLRATLRGWAYAVENAGAIGPMIVKYRPDADPELESARAATTLPLVNTGEDRIGWMKPDVWAGMATTLREQGVLTAPLDVTQVYTTQFMDELARSGQ